MTTILLDKYGGIITNSVMRALELTDTGVALPKLESSELMDIWLAMFREMSNKANCVIDEASTSQFLSWVKRGLSEHYEDADLLSFIVNSTGAGVDALSQITATLYCLLTFRFGLFLAGKFENANLSGIWLVQCYPQVLSMLTASWTFTELQEVTLIYKSTND